MTNRKLLPLDEAADTLGLSPWTLRLWARKGKVASHKVSTRLMFANDEIQRIIAESERPRLEVAK